MRVVFVQSYPIYHDVLTTEDWLELNNRDRWMPGMLAQMGHDVELWAGAHEEGLFTPTAGDFGPYAIRLFKTDNTSGKTKYHYSDTMVSAAQTSHCDLYILKGADGGIGERLIRRYLKKWGRPYVFVIGGEYYSRFVPQAQIVFYETQAQFDLLVRPKQRFFRRRVASHRLIRLPKSIDTTLFRPMPGIEKKYDVISVGRLIHHYKNYDALGALSEVLTVAMIGTGPAAADLKKKYPRIVWLGALPNDKLTPVLNQARMFMHTSLRDHFPRVLAEAAACGLPCLAFAKAIKEDVIPDGCGLRLKQDKMLNAVVQLSQDENRLNEMSRRCRAYAVRSMGKTSSRQPMEEMLRRIAGKTSSSENIST